MDEQLTAKNIKSSIPRLLSTTKDLLIRAKKISSWSFPAKIVFTALVGGLGGSSLVGFLSEYATYVYCISYGIRPPAEGIPYLKATITTASIFLLLSGAVIFIFAALILKYFIGYFVAIERLLKKLKPKSDKSLLDKIRAELSASPRDQMKNLSRKRFFLFTSPLIILLISLLMLLIFTQTEFLNRFCTLQRYSPVRLSILTALLLWIPSLVIWRPKLLWWLAAVASLMNILFWIGILFTPKYHAELLKSIGYGGGLPVFIELKEKTTEPINGQVSLLLRTSSSVIILDVQKSLITEIPIEQVAKIRHRIGGLYNMQSLLP